MLRIHFTSKRKDEAERCEREKMERLEQAESDLADLRNRAARVIVLLTERQRKNHWREAIENMIQGAH